MCSLRVLMYFLYIRVYVFFMRVCYMLMCSLCDFTHYTQRKKNGSSCFAREYVLISTIYPAPSPLTFFVFCPLK